MNRPMYTRMSVVALLAAIDAAAREGRIVTIIDDPVNKPEPIAALISGPITLKVAKPKPERCHERPHKKWPVRR